MSPEAVSGLIESGITAGLLVVVLRWMMTRFEKQLADVVEAQQRTAQQLSRVIAAQAVIIGSMQKQLLAHDLTVSGFNGNAAPEAVTAKYEEMQRTLNDTMTAIKELAN